MNTLTNGRRTLLTTAAILAIGAAGLLTAPLSAAADQMAAMTTTPAGDADATQPVVDVVRHTDGRPAYCQWHVWFDPCRAQGRPAQGRPRVLCDAGRDLHRAGFRHERRAH